MKPYSVQMQIHKDKNLIQVHNVALFRCDKCEIFFKSKKGYGGHIQNRHSPKIVGSDGKPKSKKEMEGLNKVYKLVEALEIEVSSLLEMTNEFFQDLRKDT
jgi:uncharacterized C2H2 Zn-finger protein